MGGAEPRIVVVGGGIVGASVAYHLARRGAEVTLMERYRPAGGVTGRSFGWLNAAGMHDAERLDLHREALQDWRRLEGELAGALGIDWCGALCWIGGEVPDAAEGVQVVDRWRIRQIEPRLIDPPETALHAPGEGAVEPRSATEAFLGAAARCGAAVRTGAGVLDLAVEGGRATGVRTAGGIVAADVVVLAAGTGTPALCRGAGIELPVAASPAILIRLAGAGRLVNGIVSGPEMEVRPGAGGCLYAAEDCSPEPNAEEVAETARNALAAIRRRFAGAEDLKLTEAVAGFRPIPADGLPLVGFSSRVDGLYLAVMHPGVLLAASVGRLAAGEILDGADDPLLAACRPARLGV